jgi:hypothetical protein
MTNKEQENEKDIQWEARLAHNLLQEKFPALEALAANSGTSIITNTMSDLLIAALSNKYSDISNFYGFTRTGQRTKDYNLNIDNTSPLRRLLQIIECRNQE